MYPFTSSGPFSYIGPFTLMGLFTSIWPFYIYIGPFTTLLPLWVPDWRVLKWSVLTLRYKSNCLTIKTSSWSDVLLCQADAACLHTYSLSLLRFVVSDGLYMFCVQCEYCQWCRQEISLGGCNPGNLGDGSGIWRQSGLQTLFTDQNSKLCDYR